LAAAKRRIRRGESGACAEGAEGEAARDGDGIIFTGGGADGGNGALAFELEGAVAGVFEEGDGDAEGFAGADEAAVFESADGAEDEAGGGRARGAGEGGEAAGGLDHGLEHHDAGEDGEAGEVVAEVFLGIGDEFDRHDVIGGVIENGIDEVEVHKWRERISREEGRLCSDVAAHVDEAVCLRTWDWSETSQTITLYTRAVGMVRCLAKGSKRTTPSAAFSGGVEPLSRGEVTLHLKPTAELALLTRWDLVEVFPRLRRTLSAHHAGLYVAELVQSLAADRDPHPATYDALVEVLRVVGGGPSGREGEGGRRGSVGGTESGGGAGAALYVALARFQWRVLADAGYSPRMDVMVNGDALPRAAVLLFDPVSGGIVGASSGGGASGAGPGAGAAGSVDFRIRATTAAYITGLAKGEEPAVDGAVDGAVVERAARFLAVFAEHVVMAVAQRPLRTLRAVFPDVAQVAPVQGPAGQRPSAG